MNSICPMNFLRTTDTTDTTDTTICKPGLTVIKLSESEVVLQPMSACFQLSDVFNVATSQIELS